MSCWREGSESKVPSVVSTSFQKVPICFIIPIQMPLIKCCESFVLICVTDMFRPLRRDAKAASPKHVPPGNLGSQE